MANELYRAYDSMLKGYKEGNDNVVEYGVRCWMEQNPENPFPPDSPAYNKFYTIQNCYRLWRMGSSDYRVSRRRMITAAKQLCEMYPKRPYKFDRKGDAEDKAAKAAEEKEMFEQSEAAKQKAIEEEAERIVKAEEAARKAAKEKEKARAEWEQNEAKIRAEEEAQAIALQKAVEAKRAEMLAREKEEEERKAEEKITILGVLPEIREAEEEIPAEKTYEEPEEIIEDIEEPVEEIKEKKPNFIMRLFGRRCNK